MPYILGERRREKGPNHKAREKRGGIGNIKFAGTSLKRGGWAGVEVVGGGKGAVETHQEKSISWSETLRTKKKWLMGKKFGKSKIKI